MKRRNIFVTNGKFVIFENISRVSSFRNEEAELKRQSLRLRLLLSLVLI